MRGPEPISTSGHVMGFRSDSALGASSLTAAALRFWRPLHRHELDSRLRATPKSGEIEDARFSESDAAYRLLATTTMTREHDT